MTMWPASTTTPMTNEGKRKTGVLHVTPAHDIPSKVGPRTKNPSIYRETNDQPQAKKKKKKERNA